jgi:hypothetical protein
MRSIVYLLSVKEAFERVWNVRDSFHEQPPFILAQNGHLFPRWVQAPGDMDSQKEGTAESRVKVHATARLPLIEGLPVTASS